MPLFDEQATIPNLLEINGEPYELKRELQRVRLLRKKGIIPDFVFFQHYE